MKWWNINVSLLWHSRAIFFYNECTGVDNHQLWNCLSAWGPYSRIAMRREFYIAIIQQSTHRHLYTLSLVSTHPSYTNPYISTPTHTTQEMSVELRAVRGWLSWCKPLLHFALCLLQQLQPVFHQPWFCISYIFHPLFSAVASMEFEDEIQPIRTKW